MDGLSFLGFFFLTIYLLFYVVCKSVLITRMSMYHRCAWCQWRSEEGVRSPGTGIRGGCELLCGRWAESLDPLQQQVL